MRHLVGGLAACLVFSCQPFAPTEPGVQAFTPAAPLAADLAKVWATVEQCSGHTRAIAEIRWFEIPGALTFEHKGEAVWGYYRPPDQIVMGEEGYYLDPPLAHEMLHAILRTTDHPHEFTVECASLVTPP